MGERDLNGRPTMTDVSGNGGIMETELALTPCLPGDNCLQNAYNTTPGHFITSILSGDGWLSSVSVRMCTGGGSQHFLGRVDADRRKQVSERNE